MTTVDLSLAFVTGHPRAMALLDASGRVVVHSRGWIRQEGPIPDLVGTPMPRGEDLLAALERSSHPDSGRVDGMVREVLGGGAGTLQAEIRARCEPDDDRCVVVLTALKLEGRPAVCLEFLPVTPPEPSGGPEGSTPFRDVVEALDAVVFVTTPAAAGRSRIVHYVSPAYERVWGRPAAHLREEPLSFLDAVHPDDRDEVADNLWRESRGTWDREFRIVRPEGTIRWIHSRAFPLRNARGEVERVVTLATDVTPRREVAEALRRSRDELDQMVDEAPVALVLHQRGQVLKANRVAAAYLGEDHPAAVTRLDLMDRIHPEDRGWADPVEGTGARPADRVVRILGPRGDWVGYRAASVRSVHGSGRPVSLLALWGPHTPATPVTTTRDADAALRDERVFSEAPLGMAVVSPDGHLRTANARLSGLLGWNEAPAPTAALVDLLDPEMRRRARAVLRALARGRLPALHVDVEVRHAAGHRVPLGLHLARLEGEGSPAGILVMADDLTARRAADDRRRQEERIESLGRLAGGIAHDFNNLMTVVTGHAELVLEELPGDSPWSPDVREIRSAGLRAASLADQLLTFSRRRGGEPVPLDLGRILRQLEPSIREAVGADVDVRLDVEPGVAPVEADPALMEHLVNALVDNAGHAMPEGGKLLLTVRNRGGEVALAVTDTGRGMDPDVMAHIFEPFFTTRPQGHGTGLGLALVHGIVEERGGRAEVRSAPGEGTTITVLLPRLETPKPAVEGDRPVEARRSGSDLRSGERGPDPLLPEVPASPWSPAPARAATLLPADVLLVEDEESVLRLGVRILERQGYRVRSATTGGEAVSRLTNGGHLPDLVVADARLADLDAGTLVSAVRTVSPTLPVLLLSAFDPRDERLPRRPGVTILQKPFNAEELAAAVGRALRRAVDD